MKIGRASAAALVSIIAAIPVEACSGCGCRGGPEYRGANGRCVS